jgi:type II secretory pathway pseudopilin PulG
LSKSPSGRHDLDILFKCPHCGVVTSIDKSVVGQLGPCRSCDAIVTIVATTPGWERTAQPRPPTSTTGQTTAKRGWGFWEWTFLAFFAIALLAMFAAPQISMNRNAARRMQSGHQLRQIANALHNYHDTFGQLPRAYHLTRDGKRTLSWRVAIYDFHEIHRHGLSGYDATTAWDDPKNMALSQREERPFQLPGFSQSEKFNTGYMVITGPGTLFEEGQDINFADCKDGLSSTILAVEVKHSGVRWSEPIDLDIRTMVMQINASDYNGISAAWKDGAQVVMADGQVRFLPNNTLASTLRAMITRAGGESIPEI